MKQSFSRLASNHLALIFVIHINFQDYNIFSLHSFQNRHLYTFLSIQLKFQSLVTEDEGDAMYHNKIKETKKSLYLFLLSLHFLLFLEIQLCSNSEWKKEKKRDWWHRIMNSSIEIKYAVAQSLIHHSVSSFVQASIDYLFDFSFLYLSISSLASVSSWICFVSWKEIRTLKKQSFNIIFFLPLHIKLHLTQQLAINHFL